MTSYLDFQYTEEEEPTLLVEPFNDTITYREHILVINSSDRNKNKYPNSNNYEIVLREPFEDVCSVTLINGHIPASQYNIHKYNNIFYFSEDLGEIISINPIKRKPIHVQSVIIPEGNYYEDDEDMLAETLENELNKIAKKKYKITYNSLKNKYNFECIEENENTYFQIINIGSEKPYGNYSYDKVIKRDINGNIIYDSKGNKIYEEVFCGEYENQIPKFSIGKTLGFLNENYDALIDGKVSNTLNRKIIGINTSFLKEIKKNSFITVASCQINEPIISYSYKVINILSDTELIVDKDILDNFENYQIFTNSLMAPFLRDLFPYNPIALQIPKFRRLSSFNTIINNSFCLFNNEKEYLLQGDDDFSIIKTFNPPLGKLDKITIKFFNTQFSGSYYDFGGRDHKLVFKIKNTKQPSRYYNKNKI